MKVTIVTDASGNVLGTQRPSNEQSKASGHESRPSVQVVALPGQHVTEIDLPDEVLRGSVEDLHKAVARHLKR